MFGRKMFTICISQHAKVTQLAHFLLTQILLVFNQMNQSEYIHICDL